MKILMFGAGVINTLYGYVLAQAGNDVTHYVRPGKKRMLEGDFARLLAWTSGALFIPSLALLALAVLVRHWQLSGGEITK